MKGLIVKSPWIDYILSGKKTWEIRGCNTKKRGEIALIKSGTGCIYGTVEIVDCFELSLEQYQISYPMHKIPIEYINCLPYKNTYAWVLKNPKIFNKPITYQHPKGAVIWVNI